jgi:transposase InsO family protein
MLHPGIWSISIPRSGRIPSGGGWRVRGQVIGRANKHRQPAGYAFLHNAVDDHSRLAYTEIHDDERQETAAAFWTRAAAYFASCGITVQRVLTDNGNCYRSRTFAAALGPDIAHQRTRPYRPQTNGKVERFNRTLLDEWAYARTYASDADRCAELPHWIHTYNHHRGHTALGGKPPASRVTNLSGQNT